MEKGDQVKQKQKIRENSNWEISTGYEESLDINEQTNKILDILKSKKKELLQLKESFALEYKIEIVINVESNETTAIYLEKEIIQFCNDIDVTIDFELYIF